MKLPSQKAETFLSEKILGQPYALFEVGAILDVGMSGIVHPHRPRGSILSLGPTGVGKTESARAIAEFCYGDENKMVRFDCSNFTDSTNSPLEVRTMMDAGLPKYPDGAVLLLDEIEKAVPEVARLLLQAIDEAKVTGASGQDYDLQNWFVAVTSNLGCNDLIHMRSSSYATMRRVGLEAVAETYGPEWAARFDATVVYQLLSREVQWNLGTVFLSELAGIFFREHGIELTWTHDVVEMMVRRGVNTKLGARPLRNHIRKDAGGVLRWEILNLPAEERPKKVELYIGDDETLHAQDALNRENADKVDNKEIVDAILGGCQHFIVARSPEIGLVRDQDDWMLYKKTAEEFQFFNSTHEWVGKDDNPGRWSLDQAFTYSQRLSEVTT